MVNQKKIRMFLDDERYPPEDGHEWVIARNCNEAEAIVRERFHEINFISFDHDLQTESTGKDFANWLVEYIIDNDVDVSNFKFYTHSQNPVGGGNIDKLLIPFLESRK